MTTTRFPRIATAVAAGFVLALGAPLAANAHVTVSPTEAEPGSYSLLTFRVPNESDTAGTIELAVDLPQDMPFASVSYEPVPGWSAVVERSELDEPVELHGTEVTEAATRVVWTADEGVQIAPGEFQRFTLSVGPVPETGPITLPATQTYSDGEVVAWADTDPEADHPAPILSVTDTSADGQDSTAAEDESSATATDSGSADDGLARALGIAGLVAGAAALVLAAFAVFRRRRA